MTETAAGAAHRIMKHLYFVGLRRYGVSLRRPVPERTPSTFAKRMEEAKNCVCMLPIVPTERGTSLFQVILLTLTRDDPVVTLGRRYGEGMGIG
jgi:hypothetical protein